MPESSNTLQAITQLRADLKEKVNGIALVTDKCFEGIEAHEKRLNEQDKKIEQTMQSTLKTWRLFERRPRKTARHLKASSSQADDALKEANMVAGTRFTELLKSDQLLPVSGVHAPQRLRREASDKVRRHNLAPAGTSFHHVGKIKTDSCKFVKIPHVREGERGNSSDRADGGTYWGERKFGRNCRAVIGLWVSVAHSLTDTSDLNTLAVLKLSGDERGLNASPQSPLYSKCGGGDDDPRWGARTQNQKYCDCPVKLHGGGKLNLVHGNGH